MNHRPVPRVGRLLCGLASAFALGLLAVPAPVQGDTSTVSFAVDEFIEFVFLNTPGPTIAIVANDGGFGNSYSGTRDWRVRANRGWTIGNDSFSGFTPGLPAGWNRTWVGSPESSAVGGVTLGVTTFTVYRTTSTGFLLPNTYTGTLTINVIPGP